MADEIEQGPIRGGASSVRGLTKRPLELKSNCPITRISFAWTVGKAHTFLVWFSEADFRRAAVDIAERVAFLQATCSFYLEKSHHSHVPIAAELKSSQLGL